MINSFEKIKLAYSYLNDFIVFKKMSKLTNRFELHFKDRCPQLYDRTNNTSFDAHHIYYPAWAARTLSQIKPKLHVDIASSLHFSTIISACVPVRFYDYRPAKILNLFNFTSDYADLTNLFFKDNSIESLSCMHTIEHVGLGRYGDPLDPDGDIKAIKELKRVLAPGGSLLFVVPVGRPRIEYNAHRVYSYEQIIEIFSDLELTEFSLIPDNFEEIGFVNNADPKIVSSQEMGCGCFWFKKHKLII